jgi:hypothetical protein
MAGFHVKMAKQFGEKIAEEFGFTQHGIRREPALHRCL